MEDSKHTLPVDKNDNAYYDALLQSKHELEQGNNLITFLTEELEEYSAKEKKQ